jgi:hypothetical protein
MGVMLLGRKYVVWRLNISSFNTVDVILGMCIFAGVN